MRMVGLGIAVAAMAISVNLSAAQTLPSAADTSLRIRNITQDINVAADGRSVTRTYSELQVLDTAGVMAASQIPIIYNATTQDATVVEAHTLKADGRTIPVDSSNILTQSAPRNGMIYSDREEKIIIFPNIEPGDTLIFTSNVADKVPMVPDEYSVAHFFQPTVAADEVTYSLTVPKSIPFAVSSHGMKQEISNTDTSIVYRWKYSNSVPTARRAQLVFDPDAEPHFSASSFETFDAMAHSLSKQILNKVEVTAPIQNKADAITAGVSDQREQASLIYRWVNQHIRYVAIEFGVGSIVPRDADWTLTNAFGDCKDQAVLFAALLKAKGIPSELVLINATNRYQLEQVPTLSEFNHMIVWLPQWNVYADTTASDVEFGLLPMVDYGKPVVHLVEVGNSQHVTPLIAAGQLNSLFKVHATMMANRQFVVEASTSATGPWDDILHRLGNQIGQIGPAPAASKLLKLHGFNVAEGLLSASVTQPDGIYSLHGTFRTGVLTSNGNVFSVADGMRILDKSGDGPIGPLGNMELSDSEETPCYNAHQTEDIVVDLPAGEHLQQVPQDLHLKSKTFSYDTRWQVNGNSVSVRRDFSSSVEKPVCAGQDRVDAAAALRQIRADYAASTSLAVR